MCGLRRTGGFGSMEQPVLRSGPQRNRAIRNAALVDGWKFGRCLCLGQRWSQSDFHQCAMGTEFAVNPQVETGCGGRVHLAAMFLITFYCPCKAEFLHQQHEENEQGRSDDE